METQLDVLFRVVDRLDAAAISYMISGSMALNFYAEPRMTRDVDIVVELPASDVDRFTALFADEFYCEVQSVRRAVQRQGMFNIIHSTKVAKVDFIVRKNTEYRRLEFTRRRLATIRGKNIWIAAPEDLLLSKLLWLKQGESPAQRNDLKTLLTFVAGELDWPYVQRWSEQLGVKDLLAEVKP